MRILREPTPTDGGSTATTSHSSAPIIGGAGASKQSSAIPKVEMPKPVPEHVKKLEFDISSFDVEQLPSSAPVKIEDKTGKETIAKETPAPKVEEKKEEKPLVVEQLLKPPVKEEKKVEEKKVEALKVEQKKAAIPEKMVVELPGKQTAPQQRDYTGFSEQEQRALKQMSNEGFELASRVIKENRELAKLKDSTYLQHEHAYILDPSYQEAQMNVRSATIEGNHFLQQLDKAERGEDIRDFIGWSKEGNPVYGEPIKPTAPIIEQLRAKYQRCLNLTDQFKQKANEIPQRYKQQITQDMKAIEDTSKEMFSWEKDEKLLDHTLPFEYADGVKEVPLRKIRDDFVQLFPPYMRNHPATKVAANMAVAMRIGALQLAQAQTQTQVQDIQQKEVQRGEPTTEARPKTPDLKEVHGVTEFQALPI